MPTKVIIGGGGKVGTYLANMLLKDGFQVRVIEQRPASVERLKEELPSEAVVAGSCTDPVTLEAAGIHQTDVVAAVTGADQTNLVVTQLARFEYRVPRTIARVNNPKNTWLFTAQMGVDVAVNQADLMAHLIAEEMSVGDMITLMKLRKGKLSLVEEKVDPGAPATRRTIGELGLPPSATLISVIRDGEPLTPHGELLLQPMDEVLAIVRADDEPGLAALLHAS